MMTTIVLGLDALDYELVQEFHLSEIKQEAQTRLCIEDFFVDATPLIWSSMLVGKIIPEIEEFYRKNPQSWIYSQTTMTDKPPLYVRVARKLLTQSARKFLSDVLMSIFRKDIISHTGSYLKQHEFTTILEELKSWHNSIPGYDWSPLFKKEHSILNVMGNKDKMEERKRLQRKVWEKNQTELHKALERKDDFDLIFWYTNWLDASGHLDFRKVTQLKTYSEANNFVKNAKRKLDADDRLYIVSDHGMKPLGRYGVHRQEGFFSSNDGKLISKPQELYFLLKEVSK